MKWKRWSIKNLAKQRTNTIILFFHTHPPHAPYLHEFSQTNWGKHGSRKYQNTVHIPWKKWRWLNSLLFCAFYVCRFGHFWWFFFMFVNREHNNWITEWKMATRRDFKVMQSLIWVKWGRKWKKCHCIRLQIRCFGFENFKYFIILVTQCKNTDIQSKPQIRDTISSISVNAKLFLFSFKSGNILQNMGVQKQTWPNSYLI